ncbi:acyloxyacyl hydrolase [Maritimibacter sp. DP1N21-5]|uniref:acyloxyacyl hydrolase n=2 Tax=Roseobacteraceae TaxID=2854170 RepID=UPI001C488833|nr:acyloxyacyl hydrolase [Tateyamaria omphalii]MBV7409036.1 acyloxyacyl hydrolase [Maritimibacter sp. DP1N21-5]MBY5934277.1 acyloxyacyl hydrolase [Tateyamaria omphalii]
MLRICFAFFILFVGATSASAQEWTLGLGTTDFGDQGQDSLALDLEYRHTPFIEKRVLSVAWGVNVALSAEGDSFIGGGIWSRWQWQNGWFIDNSIMPGFFEEGTAGNDLGSSFEIRSLLGVGYQFDNGHALSAAISHKSNASLADDNPGMNTYTLRYHFRF